MKHSKRTERVPGTLCGAPETPCGEETSTMSPTPEIDIRTFQAFYPDPEKRRDVHYIFAHKFLPFFIYQDPRTFFSELLCEEMLGGTRGDRGLIHLHWTAFEAQSGLIEAEVDPVNGPSVVRRISELSLSLHVVADKPVAVVQMPNPEHMAHAYFVAAVLLGSAAEPESWPPDVGARVFTLEFEGEDAPRAGEIGVFCEWMKNGTHANYSFHTKTEQSAFLQGVATVLQSPGLRPSVTITPPRGEASERN